MIFYFSGTGNTRWVAQFLAQELNDTLRFIPDEIGGDMHYKLKEGERLGFVFPCYGWGVPPFVERFIEQVQIEKVDYLYFITTRKNFLLMITCKCMNMTSITIIIHSSL